MEVEGLYFLYNTISSDFPLFSRYHTYSVDPSWRSIMDLIGQNFFELLRHSFLHGFWHLTIASGMTLRPGRARVVDRVGYILLNTLRELLLSDGRDLY